MLRFIVDSHPEFACPPETSVATTCAHIARIWAVLEDVGADSARPVEESPVLAPEAITAIRDAADRVYGRYLRRRGKRRWCDKSLDSFQHAELLLEVYPEAKFICLYRHCMDVIASGVEACPWGVHRYGFDPYVAQNPGNNVAAIGSYWLATVQAMLAFEAEHPDSCHRIRYEDLATAPEDTVAAMLSFLGAEQAPGITRQCFETSHDGNGPGDEKVWFSGAVTAGSVGRGTQIPVAALPSPVRQGINQALGKLDYRLVDDEWQAAVGRLDPRAHPAAGGAAANGQAVSNGHAAHGHQEVAAAAQAIADRIGSRTDADLRGISARWRVVAGKTVAIVVEGTGGEHEEFRWKFAAAPIPVAGQRPHADGEPAGDDEEEPVAMIIASPATWRSLLNREVNLITELTAGRVRCINRRDGHRLRSDEMHAVAALLGLIRIPVALAS